MLLLLMCLALSQHHAALALSCALLCLSITLLLLSHVPCFVSASRCSCSLMCLALSQHHVCSCSLMCPALSQHHAALALSCALLCLSITLLLLSHVPCFVSASRCSCRLFLMCLALSQFASRYRDLQGGLSIFKPTMLSRDHVPCCSLHYLCLTLRMLLLESLSLYFAVAPLIVSKSAAVIRDALLCLECASPSIFSPQHHAALCALLLSQHDITPLFSSLYQLDIANLLVRLLEDAFPR